MITFDGEIVREFDATPHRRIWYALVFDGEDIVDLAKRGIEMRVEVNKAPLNA